MYTFTIFDGIISTVLIWRFCYEYDNEENMVYGLADLSGFVGGGIC